MPCARIKCYSEDINFHYMYALPACSSVAPPPGSGSGHGRCNGGSSIAQEHACAMNRQNAQMLIYAKENHLLSKASAPNSKTAIEASTATVTASFGL